ncbi:alpha/beta fold hydrolase [Candidatus Woesearchaeota archaeon]|nr:alpha/beta fold hydrolase [Candidatus Woesearchaeota archaeon]
MIGIILTIIVIVKEILAPSIIDITQQNNNIEIEKNITSKNTNISIEISNYIIINKTISKHNFKKINIQQEIIPSEQLKLFLNHNNYTQDNKEKKITIKINKELIFCNTGYIKKEKFNETIIEIENKNAIYFAILYGILKNETNNCEIKSITLFDIAINNITNILEPTQTQTINVGNYKMLQIQPKTSPKLNQILDYQPTILSSGLWSNLYTWYSLAKELAQEGYHIYKIELTGNPKTECNTCENYNFNNITNNVLPKYLEKIKQITNKTTVTYIGHSNGCRSAIYYLEKNNNSIIKNLIGIGCPGEFNQNITLTNIINENSQKALIEFAKNNITHFTFDELKKIIWNIPFSINSNNKISTNLIRDYFLAMNTSKNNIGQNIHITNAKIIYGNLLMTNDFIVLTKDPEEIFQNINAKNKTIIKIFTDHLTIAEHKKTIEEIKKSLTAWNQQS